MKSKCSRKLLGTILLIAAAILPTYAQTTGQMSSVVVFIPFDFVVADKTIHSGPYELMPISERVLSIQSADGSDHAFVRTVAVSHRKTDDLGRLVFNCYGDRCFLSKVWAAGRDLGWELMKCQSEKQLAAKPPEHGIVVLDAKR